MTLVMLAIGRSVSGARCHSNWPVLASARMAPLAFTPLGAPLTLIVGLASECRADGRVALGVGVLLAGLAGGLDGRVSAGRGAWAVAEPLAPSHAATAPTPMAARATTAIRALSRTELFFSSAT